jgi:haloalkane dehalogenase
MHGNPSWSYLYRKMIPGLLTSGRRVIAPDLVGLGRSDKPAKRKYYTQARHIDWMQKWLIAMDLQNITLFCQDWGGVIGLNLVADNPERFDRVIVANSGMPAGEGGTKALLIWQFVMKFMPVFPLKTAITKPVLTLFGNRDPISRGDEQFIIDRIPGAKGQSHKIIDGGGHFIQEDKPKELVAEIIPFLAVS